MHSTWFHWSGGKDSAYALLHSSESYSVSGLVTSLSAEYRRVSMHGVREELLDRQALALGLPLHKVLIPKDCTMEEYGDVMREEMLQLKERGMTHCAFGDIFLEDLKQYRVQQMDAYGVDSVFPIWKKADTSTLAHQIIESGIKAVIVCVNGKYFDAGFAGREYDASFLNDLPEGVDPCGENGEFHTFVYDAPHFQQSIPIQLGDTVDKLYTPTDDSSKESVCSSEASWDTEFYFKDLLLGG